MQGRGVSNYDYNPSHAVTTSTSEFDDALIKHGIVTTNQVMLAKGASPDEAFRLALQKEREENEEVTRTKISTNWQQQQHEDSEAKNNGDDDSEEDSFDDEAEDDEFFSRYREERLAELQKNTNKTTVEHISRTEWSSKVNKVSLEKLVLITLVDNSGSRRQYVDQELNSLAGEFSQRRVSFLTIEATDAIANWPSDQIPATFAYRGGVKRHEWTTERNGGLPTRDQLEQLV